MCRFLYFVIIALIFIVPVEKLKGHEDPVHEYVHFHNVEWDYCYAVEVCLFYVNNHNKFLREKIEVIITYTYGPNNNDPGCMAEYRYSQIILSELENRFKNSKLIELLKCQKETDYVDFRCDVLVDGKSTDKWLKRKFFLRDFYIPWCEQLEPE